MNDIIVAIATAQGQGALAIIRLSGRGCIELVSGLFSKNLSEVPTHTIHYGFLSFEGEEIDEVMISVFRGKRSFTAEDSIEISCHASTYIQQKIVEAIIRSGARLARAGEFSMRAFLNGRVDLSQAEAIAELIASGNQKSHEVALKQMKGGFSHAISELRQALIHFASMIELELDFGEEDVEFADRGQLVKLITDIRTSIAPLIKSFQLGNVIKHGVATVIAGRPNAGKSTLLNAFLNEDRAIVSDIAGTTRDTIEEVLNINGLAFRLIDTAGIREANDQIEAIGVERTFEMVRKSAVLVYMYDKATLTPAEVLADLERLETDKSNILVVANKQDVFTAMAPDAQKALLATNLHDWDKLQDQYQVIEMTASTGEGLKDLEDMLYNMVAEGIDEDAEIVTNARHYESLVQTDESLSQALQNIEAGISGDLIAMDIRHAIRYLGEITGEITTDDLLENIFSRFCIGK